MWPRRSYQFDLSSTRLSSNNFFNALDPAISARFSFSYTQPLVRGRKTDDLRRKIEIAKKNLQLTDVQFRQRATDVITRIEHAYWELVHVLKSLQVQTEAVKQTRAQVETNKRRAATCQKTRDCDSMRSNQLDLAEKQEDFPCNCPSSAGLCV